MTSQPKGRHPLGALISLVLTLLVLNACQVTPDPGNGGGSGGGGKADLIPMIISGTVQLPAGASLEPQDLSVNNSLGTAPIGSDGTFELSIFTGGPHLAMVESPTGAPVLLGWLSENQTVLSPRSTAEVLVYFASGAYASMPAVMMKAVELLAASPDLTPLERTLADVLATNPEALLLGDERVAAALQATLERLGALLETSGVVVTPSEGKSGIVVNLPSLNGIQLTNHYRRRAAAFVDQIGYTNEMGETLALERLSVARQDISPTAGLTSVVSAFTDIFGGKIAWTPVSGAVIELPVHPAEAVRSSYRLTVVGPGSSPGDFAALTAEQQAALRDLWLKTVVVDFLIPITTNVLIPLNKDSIENFLNAVDSDALVQDFINILGLGAPKVWEKAAQGDMQGAVLEAWNAVVSSGTVKLAYQKLMPELLYNVLGIDAYHMVNFAYSEEGFGTKLDAILKRFNLVFFGTDQALQVTHIASSKMAERWELEVGKAKVKLTPERSWIGPYESNHILEATVPEATGDNPPTLTYHWTNTGSAGRLSDGIHYGNDFDSSRNFVIFAPEPGLNGLELRDTVTVEVFEVAGSERHSLGTAQATVTVRGSQPLIVPHKASVEPGKTKTFEATLNPPLEGGAKLLFAWQASETFGTIDQAQGVVTSAATVAYTAKEGVEGEDSLSVEVFALDNGELQSLGTASATAKVEKEPTIMEGSWFVHTDSYESGGKPRYCAAVYLTFERVPGAVRYDIYGYNFYDRYYYGDEVHLTVDEREFPGYNKPCYGATHAVGNTIRVPLSGGHSPQPPDVGYYQGRFAGMVVEVTVHYVR